MIIEARESLLRVQVIFEMSIFYKRYNGMGGT